MKKLLLLAVIPDCPESYGTVKLMLDRLQISGVEFVFSGDLKMCK